MANQENDMDLSFSPTHSITDNKWSIKEWKSMKKENQVIRDLQSKMVMVPTPPGYSWVWLSIVSCFSYFIWNHELFPLKVKRLSPFSLLYTFFMFFIHCWSYDFFITLLPFIQCRKTVLYLLVWCCFSHFSVLSSFSSDFMYSLFPSSLCSLSLSLIHRSFDASRHFSGGRNNTCKSHEEGNLKRSFCQKRRTQIIQMANFVRVRKKMRKVVETTFASVIDSKGNHRKPVRSHYYRRLTKERRWKLTEKTKKEI